jgi:hypothetical protein
MLDQAGDIIKMQVAGNAVQRYRMPGSRPGSRQAELEASAPVAFGDHEGALLRLARRR